jgi:hypothetical protein
MPRDVPADVRDMEIHQQIWRQNQGWSSPEGKPPLGTATIVFVFGDRVALTQRERLSELSEMCPSAAIVGCSSAGEICGSAVSEGEIVATMVSFEHSSIQVASVDILDFPTIREAGRVLATRLPRSGLRHVFILSEGVGINGSELIRGISAELGSTVSVTGGLAGDGNSFQETVVIDRGVVRQHSVVAVGFYGDSLRVSQASEGGWDPFGPDRLVTKAEGNILYALDENNALDLYKTYLGPYAADLPASALLFPLSISVPGTSQCLVRTILGVDETNGTMTFAGDLPQGCYAKFMRANLDRLVDGAIEAAQVSKRGLQGSTPELALLVSCVGRKLVLNQRVEDEVEGVRDVFGSDTALTGFYSYGEIAALADGGPPELHNQTMTITTIREDPQ